MQDSRLLSTLPHPSPARLFYPCQASTALRALLWVQGVLGIFLLFTSANASDWLMGLALLTVGTLPATLLWLGVACLAQRAGVLPSNTRHALAMHIVLGAVAGWLACLILAGLGLIAHPKWLGSVLAGTLLSGVLVGLQAWRNKALQPSDTQGRLRELQARIRPHFLFNTLNSAIALVRAEPDKAESLLLDLSELFRAALRDNPSAWTLEQELDLARRYLDIENIRFGERLQVVWDLDPRAHTALLPPLILQPLVENAVVHGVEPSAVGTTLFIRTKRIATGVLIEVRNTLAPTPSSHTGHGIALSNVRERLMLMHDLESRFQSAHENGQFVVRIEVPA
jgi:two-component system, LytTR family, sensor histidine kinase AlgZ